MTGLIDQMGQDRRELFEPWRSARQAHHDLHMIKEHETFNDMEMFQTPNGIFTFHPEDVYIRNHISTGEVYESHIINDYLRPIIQKSKYIVDVGANIGCHAISYANMNPDCKIWAFEPQTTLVDVFRQNCALNKLDTNRIDIYNCALGHREDFLSLTPIAEVYDGQKGYNRGALKFGPGGDRTLVKTLDSFNLPGLDFIKIDVEGAEGLVIRGAAETIAKYRPVVFFEHNWQTIDPKVVGLDHVPTPFQELVKLGYRTFEYTDWDNYITKA
jgi:FkbM family methyltransferase